MGHCACKDVPIGSYKAAVTVPMPEHMLDYGRRLREEYIDV